MNPCRYLLPKLLVRTWWAKFQILLGMDLLCSCVYVYCVAVSVCVVCVAVPMFTVSVLAV